MAITMFGTSNFTAPAWGPDPETRGTWGLLRTCIITLGVCVYSALHLNIFHQESPWWARWLVRLKWMLIALLAPEFVVFNAWFQRRQAHRIARLLRQRSGQPEPESTLNVLLRKSLAFSRVSSRASDEEKVILGSYKDGVLVDEHPSAHPHPEPFQITHGFLIVMGGLVVDMTDDEDRVWPEWCNRLTITPACVEDCLNGDAFQSLSLDFLTLQSIEGRSKVDGLAKCIVILQALWFCTQFFARIHQALPVSLLELNTFAHALCALIIYILWWNKPGEISDPFVIRSRSSSELRDLCAAQWTMGCTGRHYERQSLQRREMKASGKLPSVWTPTFTHGGSTTMLNFFRGRRSITLTPGSGEDWYLFRHDTPRWEYFPRYPQANEQLRLRTRYLLDDDDNKQTKNTTATTTYRLRPNQPIPGTTVCIDNRFASVEIDSITLARWQRTLQAPGTTRSEKYHHNYTVWLRDRQPNFTWPRGLDSADGTAIASHLTSSGLMFLSTSLCYGAAHLLTWDSGVLPPPHSAQDICWKISCLLLVGFGPLVFSLWAGMRWWKGPDAHLNLGMVMSIVAGIIVVLVLLAYVVARVYLLVEVFQVLPYMDPGVYKVPSYSMYWPHIG